jgi:hypothetical protein
MEDYGKQNNDFVFWLMNEHLNNLLPPSFTLPDSVQNNPSPLHLVRLVLPDMIFFMMSIELTSINIGCTSMQNKQGETQ